MLIKFNYKLKSLPKSFGNLQLEESLNLSNNNLASLPKSFRPKYLKVLNLSNNQFEPLPESFVEPEGMDIIWDENADAYWVKVP